MKSNNINQANTNALLKALMANQTINAAAAGSTPGDGSAMRMESLEHTLRVVTASMDNIKLFKTIPKLPAYNAVEQYNVLKDHGSSGLRGFMSEGGLPSETSATYSRNVAIAKFMGVVRSVTHPMTLVNPAHGDVIAQETISGTMSLIQNLERSLMDGDASVDEREFDGFKTMIERGPSGVPNASASPDTNVVDLRGAALSEDLLTDTAMTMNDAPNYGVATHMFLNPRAHANLIKGLFPKARYDLLQKRNDGMIGLDVGGFVSPSGNVGFETSTFIQPGDPVPTERKGQPPAAPTAVTAVAGNTGTATYRRRDGRPDAFQAGEEGVYHYTITAVGLDGVSLGVAAAAPATVTTANNIVTVTIRNSASGEAPRFYEIYRSGAGGGVAGQRKIARIKAGAPGTDTVFVDANADLPGTTFAVMFQMNTEAVSFKQLSPMLKIPLATVDTRIRWMQVLYGTPVLYAPGKIALVKNIGMS